MGNDKMNEKETFKTKPGSIKLKIVSIMLGVMLITILSGAGFMISRPISAVHATTDEKGAKVNLVEVSPKQDELALKQEISINGGDSATSTENESTANQPKTQEKNANTQQPQDSEKAGSVESTKSSQTDVNSSSQNSVQISNQSPENNNDYIIDKSSSELLTDSDIKGMTAKELNYAKNEIYARHGRMFKSKELQSYFNSKSWYKSQYSAEEFDKQTDAILSETEKKNIDFLRKAEYALEPDGYQPT